MSAVILKGKYLGSTFQEVLDKDLNYCRFILALKFPSVEMKEFQDFLKDNIDAAIEKYVKLQQEIIAKRLSR